MKYNNTTKREYMAVCQQYNHAAANLDTHKQEFVILSLRLHVLKGQVPRYMRTANFVENVA